jgi:hypothetical protein
MEAHLHCQSLGHVHNTSFFICHDVVLNVLSELTKLRMVLQLCKACMLLGFLHHTDQEKAAGDLGIDLDDNVHWLPISLLIHGHHVKSHIDYLMLPRL